MLFNIPLSLTLSTPLFYLKVLWGVRLAGYLFHRVLSLGEDKRLHSFYRRPNEGFLDPKKSFFPLKLAGFWLIQAAWAFVCLLPVTYLNSLSVAGGCFTFPRFKVHRTTQYIIKHIQIIYTYIPCTSLIISNNQLFTVLYVRMYAFI